MAVPALVLAANAAEATDFVPPKVNTETPTGISLSDLTFNYTATDLSIGTLTLTRFHLSGLFDNVTMAFGTHMSHNFDIYADSNTTGAVPPRLPQRYKPIVHMGNQASGTYARGIGSSLITPSSDDAGSGILALSGSAYVYTTQDGTVYTFNPAVTANGNSEAQRVSTVLYPGGRLLTFSYNSSKQLKEVNDNSGYAVIFDYNGSGMVSAACGFNLSISYVTPTSTCTGATLKTGYSYTSGVLTSITDTLGNVTTLGYDGTGTSGVRITCITPPGYSTCKIKNSSGQQILGDGSTWNFTTNNDPTKARDPNSYADDDPTGTTTVIDPAGKHWIYSFSKTSPYDYRDPNGHVTHYRYTGGNDYDGQSYPDPQPILAEGTMLVEADLPEGNKYLAEYNGPLEAISKETWVPKPGSALANVVISYVYAQYTCSAPQTPQNCSKPISRIDGNGNETDYSYYDFGAVKSEMDPAPVANAARPLKLYDYGTAQLHAYVLNSSGALVASPTGIWELRSMTECQTASGSSPTATCDPAARQIVTTYEYATTATANALLPRGQVVDSGTGKLNLHTCYGYDNSGNKISETKANAGLATCP